MPVIQVALPIPLYRIFEYLTPIGVAPLERVRVRVPFGQYKMIGIITKCNAQSELPLKNFKYIDKIIDNESLFSCRMWQMLNWAAEYYHYPIGKVLFHALPIMLRKGRAIIHNKHKWQWVVTEKGKRTVLEELKRTPQQQRALAILLKHSLDNYQVDKYRLTEQILSKIKAKGLVEELECVSTKIHDWRINHSIHNKTPKILSNEQIDAIKTIREEEKQFAVWLLTGVSGSGKKEVYLNIIEKMLTKGYQALVLVPEISLISQTVTRFKEHFNVPIHVLHSRLNNSEQLEVWLRARNGESAIIIGTRSALFTPFAHLGIIIIDREHDISYKQHTGWMYHARDLAILRARKEDIPIILTSSSPSLETLYNVTLGKYRRLRLTKRFGNTGRAIKYLLDLKNIPIQSGLSQPLLQRIKIHIKAGNKVMLFLNSRAFSSILLCHKCNWIFKCKHCSCCYNLHNKSSPLYLRCRYCNDQESIPKQCPQCGSHKLLSINSGSEQLKNQLSLIFPTTNIINIDQSKISQKNILKQDSTKVYKKNSSHILISTYVLTKRYNINNITLLAMLDIDRLIFSADFHALERFAQLYAQITEIAEKGNKQSEIVLQTNHPEHPLVLTLLKQGYDSFAAKALKERKEVCLPPYTKHVIVRANDYDNNRALNFLSKFKTLVENNQFRDNLCCILGPIPSLHYKDYCGRFRWQLILQHHSRTYLQKIIKNTLPLIRKLPEVKQVQWAIDVDPTEN